MNPSGLCMVRVDGDVQTDYLISVTLLAAIGSRGL